MRISEVSAQVGLSERMLRYYEQEGLVSPGRDENGYRNYSAGDIQVVSGIAALASIGLKIEHIREMLPCLRPAPLSAPTPPELLACPGVVRALGQRLGDLDERIGHLQRVRAAVAGQLAQLTPAAQSAALQSPKP